MSKIHKNGNQKNNIRAELFYCLFLARNHKNRVGQSIKKVNRKKIIVYFNFPYFLKSGSVRRWIFLFCCVDETMTSSSKKGGFIFHPSKSWKFSPEAGNFLHLYTHFSKLSACGGLFSSFLPYFSNFAYQRSLIQYTNMINMSMKHFQKANVWKSCGI